MYLATISLIIYRAITTKIFTKNRNFGIFNDLDYIVEMIFLFLIILVQLLFTLRKYNLQVKYGYHLVE